MKIYCRRFANRSKYTLWIVNLISQLQSSVPQPSVYRFYLISSRFSLTRRASFATKSDNNNNTDAVRLYNGKATTKATPES